MELKESSHSLSELLGDDGPIPDTIGLTPQLVDDELPVLPSSSQACGGTIRTVSSTVITQAHQPNTGSSASSSATSKSNSTTRTSVTASRPAHQTSTSSSSSSRVHHLHGTGTVATPHSHTHASIVTDDIVGDSVLTAAGAQRKRSRRASIENRCVCVGELFSVCSPHKVAALGFLFQIQYNLALIKKLWSSKQY